MRWLKVGPDENFLHLLDICKNYSIMVEKAVNKLRENRKEIQKLREENERLRGLLKMYNGDFDD